MCFVFNEHIIFKLHKHFTTKQHKKSIPKHEGFLKPMLSVFGYFYLLMQITYD